ncbi:hypothetical protein PV08_08939 [Exophiala spinifera]|uniref:Uncharacterized protein n=1 Tax=Exophiala spinifera TaxID=91928 RepID=A0A0D2B461_9EURO|nr:uncharacterized protein PV08_08939 [Exophiala spinifera]KIW13748.1 hypothetical protein PV08_08939 [Exophiala spinifera]
MASTAPISGPNVKDALYLVEFLQQNPQAITFNVTPLADKTGAKARSIESRLKSIRKRNRLNIIVSANSSSTSGGSGGPKGTTKSPVKDEGSRARDVSVVKQENENERDADNDAGYVNVNVGGSVAGGLPSPVDSIAGSATKTNTTIDTVAGAADTTPLLAAGAAGASPVPMAPKGRGQKKRVAFTTKTEVGRDKEVRGRCDVAKRVKTE